jgi:hypothetical protein
MRPVAVMGSSWHHVLKHSHDIQALTEHQSMKKALLT